jgi:putative membrane protein
MPFGGPLLLIVIVGFVIFYFSRRDLGIGAPSPREILDRRYAAGEITKDQHEQTKRDLGI